MSQVYIVLIRIDSTEENKETVLAFKNPEGVFNFCNHQIKEWAKYGMAIPPLETTNFTKQIQWNTFTSIVSYGNYLEDGYMFEISVSKSSVEE